MRPFGTMSTASSSLADRASPGPGGRRVPPPQPQELGAPGVPVLGERPPTRTQLASLLFPEADDPLGALRWCLAEIRRGLGAGGVARR